MVAVWERADGKFDSDFDAPLSDPAVLREVLVVAHRLNIVLLAPGAP